MPAVRDKRALMRKMSAEENRKIQWIIRLRHRIILSFC